MAIVAMAAEHTMFSLGYCKLLVICTGCSLHGAVTAAIVAQNALCMLCC